MYIYVHIQKPESVKDYKGKYFFYQYSDFRVFTRQSSVENCYQSTNYNIMVSNKNDVDPGVRRRPSHINVFSKQPILNAYPKLDWRHSYLIPLYCNLYVGNKFQLMIV